MSGMTEIKHIGITGGIGSGKSSVIDLLKKQCRGAVISADEISRKLMEPGGDGWNAIVGEFGGQFLEHSGNIDRKLLRGAIIENPRIRFRLNRAIHPLVRNGIAAEVTKITKNAGPTRNPLHIFIEVPLLFEAGWQNDYDSIIVVFAPPLQCIKRLMFRDRIERSEAEQTIAMQEPICLKTVKADHVIDNSGPWLATYFQVLHLCGVFKE